MFTWNCFIVFAVVNFLISHYLFIVLLIFAQFSACVDRECNIISVLVTIVPAFNLTSVSCCAMWKFVLADELFVVISVGMHIACYLWVEHHIMHIVCYIMVDSWCDVMSIFNGTCDYLRCRYWLSGRIVSHHACLLVIESKYLPTGWYSINVQSFIGIHGFATEWQWTFAIWWYLTYLHMLIHHI